MKKVLMFLFTMAIVVGALCATTMASAAPGWRYKASHGMTDCEFSNPLTPGAAINGGVVATGYRAVTLAGQAGSSVRLTLICRRAQAFDNQGELSYIGPEASYSGPGTPRTFGVDRPGDFTSEVELPKGREWTVAVGTSPATYTLTGGSDSIAVTIQPITAPVTMPEVQGYVAPIAAKAEEAYQAADHSWKHRVFQITGHYALKVNSGNNASAVPTAKDVVADVTQGWGLDINVLPGSNPTWRPMFGLHYSHLLRQKGIVNAPSQPANGFNSFADWQTHFVGAKGGVEVMPTSFLELQLWGAIGPMISIDGNIPVSQLPNKELYTDQADTVVAVAGKVGLSVNFLVAKHLLLGASLTAGTNFSKLPTLRGPERVCSATDGSCLVRPEGNVGDVVLSPINIGVMF